MAVPTLYRARWVLPVCSNPISDGEVLVTEDGLIAEVGQRGAVTVGEGVIERDLGNAMLLPGLVNVHAHPELAMFRGALEDLPFQDWIARLVSAKRTVLSAEDDVAAARWTMAELVAAGITAIGATEMSGASIGAMAETGLRGVVYQEVFGPDPSQVTSSVEQLERDLERGRSVASDLVEIGVSPHAPYTVSDDLYRATADLARRDGLRVAVHIAESGAEGELVARGKGDFAGGLRKRGIDTRSRARSPIALLDELGILDCSPLLIHCIDVDQRDIELIAASGSSIAHCPVANARLGHALAPLPDMLAAGINVGLGTDSVASNNRLDLLEEARICSILHRSRTRRFDLLAPGDLLSMCTIDGARALGLASRIGTLEKGKEADLCAVSLAGAHTTPVGDPCTALFHSVRGSDVILTVVRGRVLYDSGKHLTMDVEAARGAIEAAGNRIRPVPGV